MAILNVNLTRIESLNMKKSLKTAVRGHKLLKDKLDELIKKLLALVEENKEIREEVETKLQKSYQSFTMAKAVISDEYIEEALMIPKQSINVDVTTKSIMSVKIPSFSFNKENVSDEMYPYGFAFTTGDLDKSVQILTDVTNILLKLAQNEKAIELLSVEIEKTRRRVNALENVMIPNYKDTIKYIQTKLDEDERASLTRLMKVKEMIIEKK